MAKGQCELCGMWGDLDVHHIFGAALRKKSTKYGLTVRICRSCHDDLHHHHPKKYIRLKRDAQKELMERMHWTIDDWHREFGKSYLEE